MALESSSLSAACLHSCAAREGKGRENLVFIWRAKDISPPANKICPYFPGSEENSIGRAGNQGIVF